jgi:hypothetical protein
MRPVIDAKSSDESDAPISERSSNRLLKKQIGTPKAYPTSL